jgi:hypothetical protein
VVRRIYTWAADGDSLRAIAARLDMQGPPPRRGVRWSRTTIRMILRGEVYLGTGT